MKPRTMLRLYVAFVLVLVAGAVSLRSSPLLELGGMDWNLLPPEMSVIPPAPPRTETETRRAPASVTASRTALSLVSETATTTSLSVQPEVVTDAVPDVKEPGAPNEPTEPSEPSERVEPISEPVPVTPPTTVVEEEPPPIPTTTVPLPPIDPIDPLLDPVLDRLPDLPL